MNFAGALQVAARGCAVFVSCRKLGSANGNRTRIAPVQSSSVQSKCLTLRSVRTLKWLATPPRNRDVAARWLRTAPLAERRPWSIPNNDVFLPKNYACFGNRSASSRAAQILTGAASAICRKRSSLSRRTISSRLRWVMSWTDPTRGVHLPVLSHTGVTLPSPVNRASRKFLPQAQ